MRGDAMQRKGYEMPKVVVSLDDWAVKGTCAYCGKDFYCLKNEEIFCSCICEDAHKAYQEDMDYFWLEDWSKKNRD